jgi:hypothetical protein
VKGLVVALLAFAALLCAAVVSAQDAPACKSSALPVVVDLRNAEHAHLIAHERAAIEAGQPRFLTWDPDDARSERRRREDLRGIPTRPGFDRDEYPPASTRESGLQPDGSRADVAYVERSENRSGGQLLGARMRGYCAGQPLIVEAGRP